MNNYSSKTEKAQEKLSESDQKILDGLQDPDTVQRDYKLDPLPPDPKTTEEYTNCQRELMGLLLQNAEMLAYATATEDGNIFLTEQLGMLFKVASDYWKQYQQVPSKQIMRREIIERLDKSHPIKSESDAEALATLRVMYLAEHTTVADWFKSHVMEHKQYYYDQLLKFKQRQVALQLVNGIIQKQKKHEPWADDMRTISSRFDEGCKMPMKIMKWDSIEKLMAETPTAYVIEGVLALGEISLIHSLPWGGKSTLIAWMIARVAQGIDCFDWRTNAMPILYVNSDKRSYHQIGEAILCGIEDDGKQGLVENFMTLDPCPANLAELERIMRDAGKPGWLILDTMRTALMVEAAKGAENDASVVKFLAPLRELAVKYNWHVTVVHHNSRTKDDYAGGAGIAGMVDVAINIQRDENSNIANVLVKSRRGLRLAFGVMRSDLGLLTTLAITSKAPLDDKVDAVINFIPTQVAEAMTWKDVYKANLDWMKAAGWTEETARKRIQDAQRAGKLQKHPDDTAKNIAPRYWRV